MSDIYRLAKPRKKGLLSLVFSRFFIIALLIILQVLLYITFYGWLKSWMPFFAVFMLVFTVTGVVYLFSCDMDSSAKLTWMFIIAIMPIPGVIFLYFTQTNMGNRLLTAKVDALIQQTRNAIPQPEGVLESLAEDGSGTDDLIKYLNRSACFPAYANTEVTYLPTGEEKFAALIESLKAARKFIFMEYFIIEEGYMWGSILEVLIQKAAEGVDVRVMYDGMCEILLLPSNYCELLREKGISARAYAPIKPIVSSHYNYRDHRKIAVIDGEVAFNGRRQSGG